ncbi:TetR/AcrR family transcriptional regulator [Nocardioides sp. R-C-SC26]|uniref:TetR/AcrR family transcriptional regulator n=1 Tax=Nocardioides sp. R-C-SC26 TaxID=2870414 RepID=UPI001E524B84|nr:TetR/AcrR family transcriptional regulator [Nocardioides sp. R-C-SC26]
MVGTRGTTTGKRRYAPRLPLPERREQLLDAALHVLVLEGFGGVTIEAIARRAGVTRPVVYSAYDGLEPLLVALLDRTQHRALDQAMGIIAEAGDPADDVGAWMVGAIRAFLDVVQRDPDTWSPILGATRGAPPLVLERIEETRTLIRSHLEQGLRAGLGTPVDVDLAIIAHLLMASVEECGRLMLQQPPRFSPDDIVATTRTLVAHLPLGGGPASG